MVIKNALYPNFVVLLDFYLILSEESGDLILTNFDFFCRLSKVTIIPFSDIANLTMQRTDKLKSETN